MGIQFIYILFVIAIFAFLILIGTSIFRPHNLEPELHDTIKSKVKKKPKAELEDRQTGQYVILGTIKETKQPHIQTEEDRFQHTVFVGPNGVGKTSHIVSTALRQDIERKDNAVVFFEGKNSRSIVGQIKYLCEINGRELKIFPDMGGYNALGIGDTPKDRAGLFADMLSLAGQEGEGNPYFLDQQRAFINTMVPIYEYVEHQKMIVEELRKLTTSARARKILFEKAIGSRELRDYNASFEAYRPGDFGEKLSGLTAFISNMYISGGIEGRAELYNMRNAESLSNAIERKAVIIIREGGARGTQQHGLGQIYIAELMRYTRSRNTQHPVWLYLDELHYYLSKAFSQFHATSREFRVSHYLGIQSLGQLDAFGEEIAESIRTNCRTHIVHNGLQYKDCTYYANEAGRRAHRVYSDSRGENQTQGTRGTHLEDKHLITPEQVKNMSAKEVLIFPVEYREVVPARFVITPERMKGDFYYTPPAFSPYPPLASWEEKEEQEKSAKLKTDNNEEDELPNFNGLN